MAGRCGTLVGATAINLFLTFSCSLIPTLIFSGTTLYDIIFLNLTLFLFSLLLSLFQAGYLKICLFNAARGTPSPVGDMLYALYHHPEPVRADVPYHQRHQLRDRPDFQHSGLPVSFLPECGTDAWNSTFHRSLSFLLLMNVYVYKLIGSLVSTLVLVPFSLSTLVMNDAPGISRSRRSVRALR